LISAASLSYDNEDFTTSLNIMKSLYLFAGNPENRILSLRGQLRSAYQLGDARKTIAAVDKITEVQLF
jgi:hypothetical protein